jgi:hypothetical protein
MKCDANDCAFSKLNTSSRNTVLSLDAATTNASLIGRLFQSLLEQRVNLFPQLAVHLFHFSPSFSPVR